MAGRLFKYLFIISLTLSCLQTRAQQVLDDEYAVIDARIRLQQFIDELNQLFGGIDGSGEQELQKIERRLKSVDIRWNVYYQTQMGAMSESDSIPKFVAEYELLKQEVSDTIACRRHRLELIAEFNKAEQFITSQDSIYQNFYRTAMQLSLVKAMASRLETEKEKEKLLFTEIEKKYAVAKAAVEEDPSLQRRMDKVEKKYVELKIQSQKIQSAEYKPWFQRIKDYLFGFAAVAIVLMFVNMTLARIKMLKQARENAKKYKDLLKGGGEDDYPCI